MDWSALKGAGTLDAYVVWEREPPPERRQGGRSDADDDRVSR
jgi:hypothetical protein